VRTTLVLPAAACAAAFIAASLSAPVPAQGADPNLARNLAATCANCHGTGGVSQGVVPSLAGLPKDDIVTKMQEFKTGKRTGTIMPQLAKGFTDEQIDLIAGWFATQKK
jgi:sulfide dehydrogenase cytochrome subunit